MILLDSQEILAAVRRSLATHVLPTLDDEFAQIQVDAAIIALDEVSHRLENGDPYIAVNARLESSLAGLATEIRTASPVVADQLDAALEAAAGEPDPRPRNTVLGEALTEILTGEDPAVGQLRDLLMQDAGLTASEDTVWMCAAAIESLQ